MKGFYAAIIAVLRANACQFVCHGKGDHEIWLSPHTGRHFTVDRSCMSRHTANAIMKQAGIAHRF